jgi:hypothetical protein
LTTIRESFGTALDSLALSWFPEFAAVSFEASSELFQRSPTRAASWPALSPPIISLIFSSALARAAAVSPAPLPAFVSSSLAVSAWANSFNLAICSSLICRRDFSKAEKPSSAKNASSTGRVKALGFAAVPSTGDGETLAPGEGVGGKLLFDRLVGTATQPAADKPIRIESRYCKRHLILVTPPSS